MVQVLLYKMIWCLQFIMFWLMFSKCGAPTTAKTKTDIQVTDTVNLFKDFDLLRFKGSKFSNFSEIDYPYLYIFKTTDSFLLKITYSKEKVKNIVFKKINGYWEANKQTVDRGYSGGRNTMQRVIIVNDTTILQMNHFYLRDSSNNATINGYSRYILKENSDIVKYSLYSIIHISQENLRNLEKWDTINYQKSTIHPWSNGIIRLTSEDAILEGLETYSNGSSKHYSDLINHQIHSSSFVYFLFRSW